MFLTNKTSGFQNTATIDVGLSDYHVMVLTVSKNGFVKMVRGLLHTEIMLNLTPLNSVMTLKAI